MIFQFYKHESRLKHIRYACHWNGGYFFLLIFFFYFIAIKNLIIFIRISNGGEWWTPESISCFVFKGIACAFSWLFSFLCFAIFFYPSDESSNDNVSLLVDYANANIHWQKDEVAANEKKSNIKQRRKIRRRRRKKRNHMTFNRKKIKLQSQS